MLKRKGLLIAFALLTISILSAPQSHALWFMTDTGTYWIANEAGSYDTIEMFVTSPDPDFDLTGLLDYGTPSFSSAGWAVGLVNPNYSLASGTTASNLNMNLAFTGSVAPVDLDFLYWLGGNLVASGWIDYNPAVGGYAGWTSGVYSNGVDGGNYDRNPVPEPATMLLLGSGLVGLARWGKRKFKK
jgi:hypothetical protein